MLSSRYWVMNPWKWVCLPAMILICSCGILDKQEQSSSTLASAEEADILAVDEARDKIIFDLIRLENADIDHVTADLSLPDQVGDGVLLEWKSENSAVAADGKVSRPLFGVGNVSGDLHALLSRGKANALVSQTLIVLEDQPEDFDAVAADAATLTSALIAGENQSLERIERNLLLPSKGKNKTTIAWKSTATGLSSSGKVTREPFSGEHSKGVLTAVVSKGKYSKEIEFSVLVVRNPSKIMITEVYPGYYSNDGWIEIYNNQDQDIDLSTLKIRGAKYVVGQGNIPTIEALPAITLAAGGFLIVHSADDSSRPGQLIDGVTDIWLSKIYFGQGLFAELVEGGVTLDFVRWHRQGALNTFSPTTGQFSGVAVNPDRTKGDVLDPNESLAGATLGRSYGEFDSDRGDDWAFFSLGSPGGANGLPTPIGTDTDGDGLTDRYEVDVSGTNPTKKDTDGDGFSDGQEILPEGLAGVNLKALGADPLVRDIFVEIDYMSRPAGQTNSLYDASTSDISLALRRESLDKVKDVFESYRPGIDGDSLSPIAIHFDVGDLFDQAPGVNSNNYDLGGGNQIPFASCTFMGEVVDLVTSSNVRNPGNCTNLFTIKQANHQINRRFVFHYMLIVWSQEISGSLGGSSGRAEIGGNDILISVGNWGNLSEVEIVNYQAATILHELGHNLGLSHGGDESTNYKPNYVSVMNYLYQLAGLDGDGNGDVFYDSMGYSTYINAFAPLPTDLLPTNASVRLGYSSGRNLPLDETALDESRGWLPDTLVSIPIDFNNTGSIEAASSISKNIQFPSYNSGVDNVPHRDVSDWNLINLRFQGSAATDWNGAFRLLGETDDSRLISPACLSRPSM